MSSASATISSNERPFAVPRSRSASSSTAPAFSARSRASSDCSDAIRSSIARRRSDCCSKAWRMTASCWRWKPARGLEGSSAANWRRRSSRDLAMTSSIADFTRWCTAPELSSEKCLASSRDNVPLSGFSAS